MADFCKQCNLELFDIDVSDFQGTLAEDAAKLQFNVELCEGCGPTLVGVEGECVALDCPKHGKENRALFAAIGGGR